MVMRQFVHALKKFWVYHIARVRVPKLLEDAPVRVAYRFFGKVQNVGFRYEMSEVARLLSLTGFAENCADGTVYAEVQGGKTRVEYMKRHMRALRRASVSAVEEQPLPLVPKESGFGIG